VFEFAGGQPAFLALAAALHERCLADPELNHPFSHAGPQHLDNLAAYLGEVFGGPARYSDYHGGHSAMLDIHAGEGAQADLGARFAVAFMQAVDDAELPDDPEFRAILKRFIDEATDEVIAYSPHGSRVPAGLRVPRWGWDGPE
jgi:hemoglobin